MSTIVRRAVAKGLSAKHRAKMKIEVIESCEIKLPEAWVSARGLLGRDRIPQDAAGVICLAIAKARKTRGVADDVDGWSILTLIAADYLAGP